MGELCINDLFYAEISAGFSRIETLEEAVLGYGFICQVMPPEAFCLAAKAFVSYRRRGGNKTAALTDFFIGAHAAIRRMPLLTRDPTRIRTAFPTVQVLEP